MPAPRPLVVMVTGVVSGLGKSTLSRHVADRYAATGRSVELFEEDAIAERHEFADVMAAFRATGASSLDQLLDASRRYIETCVASGIEVHVQDMLFPFLPSLFAWGYHDDAIRAFFESLASTCRTVELVQVHLTGDPAVSLPRAVEREGDAWLEWLIGKVDRYADARERVDDLASLVRYFEGADARTVRLLETAPWPLVVIDAAGGEADVADRAALALGIDH